MRPLPCETVEHTVREEARSDLAQEACGVSLRRGPDRSREALSLFGGGGHLRLRSFRSELLRSRTTRTAGGRRMGLVVKYRASQLGSRGVGSRTRRTRNLRRRVQAVGPRLAGRELRSLSGPAAHPERAPGPRRRRTRPKRLAPATATQCVRTSRSSTCGRSLGDRQVGELGAPTWPCSRPNAGRSTDTSRASRGHGCPAGCRGTHRVECIGRYAVFMGPRRLTYLSSRQWKRMSLTNTFSPLSLVTHFKGQARSSPSSRRDPKV